MKLTLNSADFKHLSEKSSYNHNFYKYIGDDVHNITEIYEISYEDYGYCSYYLKNEDIPDVFLGCSQGYGLEELNSIVEIDFRLFYT